MAIGIGRRQFISALGGTVFALPFAARAQQPTNIRRIGLLMAQDEKNSEVQLWVAAFREGLQQHGWIQGQTIQYEFRWVGTDPNLFQAAAKELVASHPDVILSSSSPTTAILLQQTRTIPIVFANIVDPVGQGFAASLSRPGGNATGLVNLEPSMASKWLELLKEVVPNVARVVIPYNPATSPYANVYLDYFKSSATSLGVEVLAAPVTDMDAFDTLAAAQAHAPNIGIIALPSAFMSGHASEMATIMTRYRLPAINSGRNFAEAGGLLSYGNDIAENWKAAGMLVDRILRGAKPSDLPIQFPVKFDLVINLKTARAFGLSIPPSLLAVADEVIE